MRVDMVRYFVMASLGMTETVVFYSNQPDVPDNCVTVLDDGDKPHMHTGVIVCRYQAIIRNTTYLTAETYAMTLYEAIKGLHNRATYDGIYLAAAMDGTTDPVTFAPDNGSGTAKATAFAQYDYIRIGSEILRVTSVATPNVTASRAALGTTIATHSDNDEILNLTKNPIPGEKCDSTRATSGVIPIGQDEKLRKEFSVNWEVTVKP